jgi:peptide/nickel transport system substrate-binding protein
MRKDVRSPEGARPRPRQGHHGNGGDIVTSSGRNRITLILVLAVTALLVLGIGLAGGLSAAAASGSSSPSAQAVGASPAAAASPANGKVIYKVGILGEPDNLNPFIGYLWSSFEMWYLTYEPLVGYDYATLSPSKGAQATGLATDWTVTPDGKTWNFTIRGNAKWDDGVPFTASDVAFTYNYIRENDLSNFTPYTEFITKATAVDDTHVRFDCSKPKANMLRVWIPVIPEHIWSKVSGKDAANKYQNTPPYVGSGPFKCVEWKKNSYIKLVANPSYWRGTPKIDELYFDYYTNADTMVQDLKAGTIDGATGLLDAQYRQLLNSPGIEARTVHVNGFDELGFNCYTGPSRGNPVLKDAKFRQALNWAVDKAKIAALPYGGHAVPATTVITSDYYTDPDWHWQPPADVLYGYDPEKAKQMLDAAGYKDTDGDGIRDYNGKPIKLRLWSRTDSTVSQGVGKLIAGWFEAIGLKIELQTMDDGAITDNMYATKDGKFNPDYDMFLWGWYSDLDPGSILSYFTKGQINAWSDCAWSNPEYDKLYVQQASTIDPAQRKPLIDQLQQMLYTESPYIVTVYSNDLEAYNTAKWQGYAASPAKVGNVLFPPYGNAGSENFLLIEPKTGGDATASSSNTTLIIVVAAAVAALIVVALLVVRARRPRSMEE